MGAALRIFSAPDHHSPITNHSITMSRKVSSAPAAPSALTSPQALSKAIAHARNLINADLPPLATDGHNPVGQVLQLANDSRFVEANFDQPLTTYARGWRDPNNIEATLEFFAPRTPVTPRFTYKSATFIEQFLSELVDDIRAIGANFKRVEYTGTEVNSRTYNRGLMMVVDLDEATDGWEQRAVSRLMQRLRRNSLRRAIALLSAAATNTAKTWDTSAGKDPDQDVISDLVTIGTANGVGANRVGYGHTAWSKRGLALRAQNTAGGYASAGLTPEQLAGVLMVDQVMVSKERYASTASALAEIVSNLVLMFHAIAGATTEDASNIKRFVSPTSQGGDEAVYVWQISPKLMGVAVEHYENTAITSTLGIRKFTVS